MYLSRIILFIVCVIIGTNKIMIVWKSCLNFQIFQIAHYLLFSCSRLYAATLDSIFYIVNSSNKHVMTF